MATTFKKLPLKRLSTKPKHIQVTDEIREWITSGELKPGDRLPSYNETRAQYGVHTSTMEKVFARLELEGLIVRRRGSGTFVSKRSQTKRAVTGIIGLSGAGFSFNGYSSYWAQIIGGVHDAAAEAGLQLLILNQHSTQGWEKADGVLLCDWNDKPLPRKCPPGLPLVSLLTPVEDVASVMADDHAGIQTATQHLIEQGHQRIAYLRGNDQVLIRQRLDGYRQALKAAGIRPQKEWVHRVGGFYDIGVRLTGEARKSMMVWLRDDWSTLGCTALLCHNDEAALGAMQALSEAGLQVPGDVSVMGFDGTEFCDLVTPRLSSVEVPLRAIGATGVEMLLQQIEADEVMTEHKVLPTQLRVRQSTAVPPVAE